MGKHLKLVALLLVALPGSFSAADPAAAVAISITNNSFEDPVTLTTANSVTGWNIGGFGGAGVWNINNDPAGFWTVPAPDGNQIAFISSAPAPGNFAQLSQTLVDTLQPDSIYTLTGYVGDPEGFAALYGVELLAGGAVLSQIVPTVGSQGTFDMFTLTFDSTGSSHVGEVLGIVLTSNAAQTGFDDIQLNVAAIPEPGVYAMMAVGLALMAFVVRHRRKE